MDQESLSSFTFEGTWKEYAPIAFTNLLLTIVTLGLYRAWATTRTRKYLWAKTRFIGDPLEWTGTGKELFIGFVLVAIFLGLPLFLVQFIIPAMIARGMGGLAGLLIGFLYFFMFYMIGVALFRSLRYRLSRTFWHGIRGGSNVNGIKYGWSYLWKNILGFLAGGLLVPWAQVGLWNERWGQMSFGALEFNSYADWGPVFKRYLLFYLLPIVLVFVGIAAGSVVSVAGVLAGSSDPSAIMGGVVFFIIAIYAAMGVLALAYYAALIRACIGGLSLGSLDFKFEARTWDWIKLGLGDIGLFIITLGIGMIFLEYRHWKFFIKHMEAYGEVKLDELTQSETSMSKHGEGLLDALDVGAF